MSNIDTLEVIAFEGYEMIAGVMNEWITVISPIFSNPRGDIAPDREVLEMVKKNPR